MVLLLLLYLRWLAVAAWCIALFVRLAQRYACYLFVVEQPAAGAVEILVALGDINRDVEHDGGRLRQAVGVGACIANNTKYSISNENIMKKLFLNSHYIS